MISETLRRARQFEATHLSQIPDDQRPVFHVTGGVGWINDPNGFSCFNGAYHLFFQYHPYSTHWGPMHWGHMKTSDFIHWERLPVAIAPDTDYDDAGCFSGSAAEMPDGRHLLMYTGVHQEQDEDGVLRVYQQQCIAIGDGVTYEKAPGNPVISTRLLPEGGSPADFRDPKLWWEEEENCYYAVIGNRTGDGSGSILLYRSEDGIHWHFVRILDACRNELGKMWECPDFFPLDGKHLLVISPQEVTPQGLEFHAGDCTACFIGSYDKASHSFTREHLQAIDYGLDFYAPQTLKTPDGRRILIGWMQSWASANHQPEAIRWFGEMTIPRELSLRNGRLIQNPVRELEHYRRQPVAYKDIVVTEETRLQGINGRVLDMTVTIRPADDGGYRWFQMDLAKNSTCKTTIRYTPESGIVHIDRSRSGLDHGGSHTRDFLVRPQHGKLTLRVIMDRYSIELFCNDGEQAASTIIYTPQEADSICFNADGAVIMDVTKYEIADPRFTRNISP